MASDADTQAARITSVDVGDVALSVTTCGPPDGDPVLLLHGFPEIAYSWRHQISALAAAGYRVIAPDMRGYGWSDAPEAIEDYDVLALVADVLGLLDAHGVNDCVLVGHDWGAILAGYLGVMHPGRWRGIVLASVPFRPRGERSIIDQIRATDPDGPFSYMLAFQEAGAEDGLDADPIGFLRRAYWQVSGEGAGVLSPGDALPAGLPSYLRDAEFENYARAFARSGFAGPINYYRNLHRNWELMEPWHGVGIDAPTLFVGGERDFVAAGGQGIAAMAAACPDLRGSVIIPGAGHWVQQEAPAEMNEALLNFIANV